MRAGLIGEKLTHSLSPQIHELIYKHSNILGEYKLYEKNLNEAKIFLENFNASGLDGINITMPYKQLPRKYFSLSEEVKILGAANTIANGYAYNTDCGGFAYSLKAHGIEVKNKHACILGFGGAARAVAYALINEGAGVDIITRSKENKCFLDCKFFDYSENYDGDILINATPVGMYPDVDNTPAHEETISRFDCLIDLVYNPKETMFLRLGGNKVTANGLSMLVMQAILAQELWQGRKLTHLYEKIYNELSAYE